ncbi:murein biosynthesis integral membrane protein MurJ [Aliihoeflea sp. PC F10.4]
MSLIRKFATVGFGTMASRVLGFTREMLMAAALGIGPVADAFYAAFQFPNTFRRLFAEGAFNAAFVPLYAKEVEAGGIDGARRLSEEVFGVLFSALIVLTIVMQLSMPLIVATIVAPGFASEPEKFELTVSLAFIMFPYLIFMSLSAMMAGMLNSLRHYFAAALAPIVLNIVLIGVLAYAWRQGHDGRAVGYGLAWGVLVSGIIQLAILWMAVRRLGVRIRLRLPRLTPNVKRLLWLAFPAAITGGITQINTLVGTAIASTQAAAVASLAMADRIYQLPLGVVGIAVAIVLLPELARALKAGDEREAASLQNRSVEFTLFLTLPAAAALFVIAEPIIRVLYERGQFAEMDATGQVAAILAIFGLGLPAYVLIQAFRPGYFAREDTRTPMIFAAVSAVTNITLALLLLPRLGAPGIAVASAVAAWVNVSLLFATLLRRGHWIIDRSLARRVPRLVAAAFAMGLALWFAADFASPWLQPSSALIEQIVALLTLCAGGAIVYFALAFAIGGADVATVRRALRRRGKASTEDAGLNG